MTDANIPIIDFSAWTSENSTPAERLAVSHQLVKATHDTGFVYINNHGISPQLVEEAFTWSKKFFDLPQEKKMEAKHPEGSLIFRGYTWPGLWKVNQILDGDDEALRAARAVPDYNENYGLGSEENIHEPNIWPPEPTIPGFRDFTTKFYWECWRTGELLMRALAIGLGLDDEYFLLKYHDGHSNELSLLHYLPVAAEDIEMKRKERMAAHSDFGSITLLFQDDCGGLEIEVAGQPGKFVPVARIENTFVMNIGDILKRWTNDYLTSALHRVRLPPLQDRFTGQARITRARYSIPYFIVPKHDTMVECLPACYDEENPPKYSPISWRDYGNMRAANTFGKY